MSDYLEDDIKIVRTPIQPQKYNIVLTKDGGPVSFDFPPATAELISRFGLLTPNDKRCSGGLVEDEDKIYTYLSPILGKTYKGNLIYHTSKQVIISLHDTAILGYQRQRIIDPRISNEIATFWEIYLDQRIFPDSLDTPWRQTMAEIISYEQEDDKADAALAEDIKNKLLQEATSNPS